MIEVAISYGFGEENRYNLEEIPADIQLAIWRYERFKKDEERIVKALEKAETNVSVSSHAITSEKGPDVSCLRRKVWRTSQSYASGCSGLY